MRRCMQTAQAILRRDHGSVAVETAISCTIVVAMLLGISQISLAMYAYQFVSHASREATRYAIVRGDTCSINTPLQTNCNATAGQISTYVQSLGFKGIQSGQINVNTVWCAASVTSTSSGIYTTWPSCSASTAHDPGNLVKVTVSYPISASIAMGPKLSFSVSSTSQMVISQ